MRRGDHAEALERASAPALDAIERDRQRAPKHLWPVFEEIAEMIFEPDVDLDRIARALGDDDAWFHPPSGTLDLLTEVGEEVGRPPWDYLRDGRFQSAGHLLLETTISLGEIGKIVGYASRSSFRRSMRIFLGMQASEYRRRAPRILERGGPPPDGADTDEYWERMLAGELSDDEARALDAYLARLAPASAPAPESAKTQRRRRLYETLADGFVYTLERLDFADGRRLVRDAVVFPDGTFFERLSRQSREAADDDPESRRGVEWALLAIDSLAANEMLETCPELSALGWARLALVRWRADDLSGAEKDLARCERDAGRIDAQEPSEGTPGAPALLAWEAERGRVAAAFHWHQGRRRQALEHAEGAVAAHRAAGANGLAKALILRAELRAASTDLDAAHPPEEGPGAGDLLDEALADAEEARGLLARAPVEEQVASFRLWARILVLTGDPGEIVAALPEARRSDLGDAAAPLLPWLEGHCPTAMRKARGRHGKPDTESLWRRARDAFAALGDEPWVARVTLDLARLGLSAGRAEEVSALASELAANLGAAVTGPEDLTALKALARAATTTAAVTGDDLDRAERVLKRLDWRRRASRALRLAL